VVAAFLPRACAGTTSGLRIENGATQSWNSWKLAPTTDARPTRRVRVNNFFARLWFGFNLRRCSAGGLGALGQDGSSGGIGSCGTDSLGGSLPARRRRWCGGRWL